MPPSPPYSPIKICRIVTVPLTFEVLFDEQLQYLSAQNIALTLVSGQAERPFTTNLPYHIIPLTRTIHPFADAKAIWHLVRLLRQGQFDITHSNTPKAGLVTAVASWLARLPIRIHTFTGQVWVEQTGLAKYMTKWSDKLIGRLSTHCYADSFSQRGFLIQEGIVPASKIGVLGQGSVAGVNLAHFNPARFAPEKRPALRAQLGIAPEDVVILFLGRITRDKGIAELIAAFRQLTHPTHQVHLLLAGPIENIRESLPQDVLDTIHTHNHIHNLGFVEDPAEWMLVSDMFCLPSYREGFPVGVLEAAAMGLPVVATAVTGTVDAVIHNHTGLLAPVKNAEALRQALQQLVDSAVQRQTLGQNGAERIRRDFAAEKIHQAQAEAYWELWHTTHSAQ
ncbi:MAG: glycosyltransferase family 4 protein [Chloroflexi bacterium]|nr:glycosyltransferase family 4 protein [Chloroflexota bacterium]